MNTMRIARMGLIAAALIGVAGPLPAQMPGVEYDGAAALGLALRKLGVTPRVLMIAAHPDDENTAVLSALALGRGADVAYLSLTRGDGGQNGIGPELQEAIGVIRSEELLAARRLDGAAQFFTRAYDYGFSKSADEAFSHWPKDSLLADVVAVIRRFRPDLVVAVFSGTPRDGHGQHQASGILAREAFAAAGDPSRFPDQIRQGLLRPHRPAKLYQSLWRGSLEGAVLLETGTYDPLLGRSHYQVAMASRSRHRSQDMGQALTPGPRPVGMRRVDVAAPDEPSIFLGVDTTLSGMARSRLASAARAADGSVADTLAAYERLVASLRAEYNPLAPDRLVAGLAEAARLLDRADGILAGRSGEGAAELRFRIAAERRDVDAAFALAAGIVVDAVADAERIVPGRSFTLEVSAWNGGARPISLRALEPALPAGWRLSTDDPLPARPLAPGELVARAFTVTVPADAPPTEPYYLRAPRDGDLYHWPADPTLRGLPFDPPAIRGTALATIAGVGIPVEREASFRTVSSVDGEIRRPVRVVPAVSVALDPAVAVLPLGRTLKATAATNAAARPGVTTRERGAAVDGDAQRTLQFSVRLTGEAPDGIAGRLRLELPAGWRAEPAEVPVRFETQGETRRFELRVTPPDGVEAGAYPVHAVFDGADGRRYDRGYELIDYPHIRPRPLYRPAAATIEAFDVRVPAELRVAYIPGAGDDVPAALAQLGLAPTLIDAAALPAADLDAFDVIVTGIRAYEHRPELSTHNRLLLEYVERGGTLIVQYNQYRYARGDLAPYPLSISRPHDRVTDETAPVRLLDPEHPALSRPNRIGAADFEGWIQERGLYYAHDWDERYTPLLEMNDPGEDPLRGGLLVARHGRGTYVYTGLAFFRQLPAGVPGAYRLFANLLSLGVEL